MDGEQTESDTESPSVSNGVNGHSVARDGDRAAFLSDFAGVADDKPAKGADKGKAEKADADEADADDDADLDADLDEDEVKADADEEPDEDSDLDEDEDKSKDDEKDVDADTAKRLTQVRRTDKRLREQREKDFADRDRQFETQVQRFEAEWRPRVEAVEKFERSKERVNVDPIGVLQSLGLKPERFEHVAQMLYTLSKKDDPKAQQAAAQLMRERETMDEIESLKKRLGDRDEADKERERQAAVVAQGEKMMAGFVKAASDKTPLAKTYLKSDPDGAKSDIARIAMKLIEETGKTPEPRAVMVAFEKERRSLLRKMGIDPKKLSATAANAAIEKSETKATPKKAQKSTAKADDEKKKSPRDEFLSGKYD